MSELNDFKKNNPNVNLNEWTEEDINVRTITPEKTEKGIKLSVKDIPQKQKVMYINAPVKKAICPKGKHQFYLKDNRKYIYACRKCGYQHKIFPFSHDFKDGQLINKQTGEFV